MSKVYNVGEINSDAMLLGDTMSQAKYQLAKMKQSKAARELDRAIAEDAPDDEIERLTDASIVATENFITSFDAIIDLIGRTAEVTDGDGNIVPASELPASVVDKIMARMTSDVTEMSDPNG